MRLHHIDGYYFQLIRAWHRLLVVTSAAPRIHVKLYFTWNSANSTRRVLNRNHSGLTCHALRIGKFSRRDSNRRSMPWQFRSGTIETARWETCTASVVVAVSRDQAFSRAHSAAARLNSGKQVPTKVGAASGDNAGRNLGGGRQEGERNSRCRVPKGRPIGDTTLRGRL